MSAFDPICGSALAELVERECPQSTAEQRAIIARWIQLTWLAIKGVPDARAVWLVVGDERFRLGISVEARAVCPCGTLSQAARNAWRLGQALLQLIAAEAAGGEK